jgi:hypothetical protein
VGEGQCGAAFAGLGADAAIALRHGLLQHSLRNVAPHRVRRLAHSLKRNIGSVAANRVPIHQCR